MNTGVNSYKDLIVWQKAIVLVTEVYRLTGMFPKQEMYALASQMQRAAVSIPSNIAEGRSRSTTKDFIHFLYISLGSGTELETQLLISKNLNYGSVDKVERVNALLGEVCRMLHGMIKKLEAGS